MKIKILKDEYIFNEEGTHVCDENGFAKVAEQDLDCEIKDEHFERVKNLIESDRGFRGLNPDGSPKVVEIPILENSFDASTISLNSSDSNNPE